MDTKTKNNDSDVTTISAASALSASPGSQSWTERHARTTDYATGEMMIKVSDCLELEKRLRLLTETAGRRMMADEPTAEDRIAFMDAWCDARDFLSVNTEDRHEVRNERS